ncbi:hypothetical protein [Streptomyces albus]|uniref:hypothetical protein n=1 Tax=Streptomyces albus TaxID=1888 RepID=UPI0024E048F5|nr:hypothetical protein [Streptomyces albus]GHJ24489.1 hypothetical protein TPA0909_61030 [Streptomyces albus]
MRKFKRAMIAGAGLLAFSGLAAGGGPGRPGDPPGAPTSWSRAPAIADCQAVGDKLVNQGLIENYACMVNPDGTVSVTPYYKD